MKDSPVLIPPIRPGRILVVDDDSKARQLLKDLLTARGHLVSEAGNGGDALAAVKSEPPPDAILLDVLMPGMDGFEVCRRLKSDPATALIHIFLITNLGDRENRVRGIECGADDFLSKPVDADEVLLKVRNAVAAMQILDELRRKRLSDAGEEALMKELRGLSCRDAVPALGLLSVGAEMMAWRVAAGRLDDADRNRLYAVYERLGAVLAKSGSPPC